MNNLGYDLYKELCETISKWSDRKNDENVPIIQIIQCSEMAILECCARSIAFHDDPERREKLIDILRVFVERTACRMAEKESTNG